MTGTDDTKAIESVIQSYLDGLHEGDAVKLANWRSRRATSG